MKTSEQSWQQQVEDFISSAETPLITVLGPTASGKTAFSISLSHFLQSLGHTPEIVNADSRQLYKHVNIGTAKITPQEMEGIPHHLIDTLDPSEEATAGWFQLEALRTIDALHSKGSFPILVGGSMLYISTITDELSLAPASEAVLRKKLIEEYDKDNGITLYKRLTEADPEAAERVHVNNKERLVRAVEIYELLQIPRSQAVPDWQIGSELSRCPYDLLILGVQKDREQLVDRINARVETMFEAGWLKEVQWLLDSGYNAEDTGMKSHGYREIMEYIQKGTPSSLSELKEIIAAKTRKYAKRQTTWWRNDPRIQWIQS